MPVSVLDYQSGSVISIVSNDSQVELPQRVSHLRISHTRVLVDCSGIIDTEKIDCE